MNGVRAILMLPASIKYQIFGNLKRFLVMVMIKTVKTEVILFPSGSRPKVAYHGLSRVRNSNKVSGIGLNT